MTDCLVIRCGACYDPDPKATEGRGFLYKVGDPAVPAEDWRQSAVLVHNPRCKHPIDHELFPGIVHYLGPTDVLVPTDRWHPLESMTFRFPGEGMGSIPVNSRMMSERDAKKCLKVLTEVFLNQAPLEDLIPILRGY